MQDMNDILNPPAEEKQAVSAVEETAASESATATAADEKEQVTGEKTQVAAEADADSGVQVKTELAALTKERERIRQKEAALDAEKAELEAEKQRLAGKGSKASSEETGAREDSGAEKKDLRTELKDLNRKYRVALQDSMMDPDDEDAARLVEELEDKMEEVRVAMVNETQRATNDREKADSDYRTTYAALHGEFPFLSPDHPQADADLNDDINTYITGRLQQGDSRVVALEKAVRRFAPAYAERMGITSGDRGGAVERKEESGYLTKKLSKGGFSEVRSAGRTQQRKAFTGPTPMTAILGGKA